MGHHEHELLFIANQVMQTAGLKNPINAVACFKNKNPAYPVVTSYGSTYGGPMRPGSTRCSYGATLRPLSSLVAGSLRKSTRPSASPANTMLRSPSTQRYALVHLIAVGH